MATTRAKVWSFVWLNALAVAAMLGIFFFVLYGDFMTDAFAAVWSWLARHLVITALAAASPFFAAILVGRASARWGTRRP